MGLFRYPYVRLQYYSTIVYYYSYQITKCFMLTQYDMDRANEHFAPSEGHKMPSANPFDLPAVIYNFRREIRELQ